MVCNMYISRNLATLRENMCVMSRHANGTLALCYACDAYRDNVQMKSFGCNVLIGLALISPVLANLAAVKTLADLALLGWIILTKQI